jgi:RNA-directed DNA polymerase
MPAERRSLSSRKSAGRSDNRRLTMSLEPPEGVGKLQAALHGKAKENPSYRFYLLYDKVYRPDVLEYAYRCCLSNGGAPGVDGQTFEDIEAIGRNRWLGELAEELRKKTYQPQAVRRVWIPKPDGKQRPLGIPTIRDRVVQMAAVVVLEPIFEADLQPEQYAYRKQHGALDAVNAVNDLLNRGYTEVVDADLSGYFDSIPHAELMKSVARRISDRHLLHLVKMWLEAPVEETDEHGRTQRTTRNKDEGRGTPQGGVASPLLANLYMRRFVLGWKTLGHAQRLDAHIVNYADDFVILTRQGRADEAMAAMRGIMGKLRLTVNETKTRVCRLPEETFDFLGYTFGRQHCRRTGRAYLGPKPSKKKINRCCEAISEATDRCRTLKEARFVVAELNIKLRGWSNYFRAGTVVHAYGTVMKHTRRRLRRWLCVKHKVRRGGYARFNNAHLHNELGLLLLPGCTYGPPCASP